MLRCAIFTHTRVGKMITVLIPEECSKKFMVLVA